MDMMFEFLSLFTCLEVMQFTLVILLTIWLHLSTAASLTALFKHIGTIEDQSAEDLSTWDSIRKKVLLFLRDKVNISLLLSILLGEKENGLFPIDFCLWSFDKNELNMVTGRSLL